MIVYGVVFLSLVIVSVLIGIFYTPSTEPGIKLIQRPPAVPVKTQPPPPQKTEQVVKKATPPPKEEKKTPEPIPKSRKNSQQDFKARVRREPVKKKTPVSAPSDYERLVSEGEQFHAKHDYVMALDRYKEALKIEAAVSLYLKIYSVCRAMGNNVLARGYIDAGLKQFPDSFAINKVAAVMDIREKNFSKALAHIETALSQNSRDYALLTYKGLCYFHRQDYEKALDNFQKSLAVNDDALENYYYIGLIHDNLKNYKKALEFYTVFFKLNPQDKNFKHRKWVTTRIAQLRDFLKK